MADNEIGVIFSDESEFRRFLKELGVKPSDIDNGRREKYCVIFVCATHADAEAIRDLYIDYYL